MPWLRLALDDTLGVFDSTLKLHAIGELLSHVGAPGAAMAPPVLGVLRAGVARCSAGELLQLRLFGLTVTAGEEAAAPWAIEAVPPLQSPRSPARRPVTFINLRDAPVDVIWIGFDGAERRYARAVDNVESRVRLPVLLVFCVCTRLIARFAHRCSLCVVIAPQIEPGRSTSWSSVVGHMWRVRTPSSSHPLPTPSLAAFIHAPHTPMRF